MSIVVNAPNVYTEGENAIVKYLIMENNKSKEVFFEFSKQYMEGLTVDRGDALLVMLFLHAMKTKQDLEFFVPISERLFYQMKQLIDLIHQADRKFSKIAIKAKVIKNFAGG